MKVDTSGIDNVLAQMRAMAAQAQAPAAGESGDKAGGADFNALLKQSLDSVNGRAQEAKALTAAFEQGDPNVELAEVMIAVQKSSISFQGLLQVRNRLVQAYQDISNMRI
ncbi:MAG: flagellar hook-basal body complex protein FliE [Gammaproteobacteria bacterium]|nr:flagellar hook-basal body complex protein FliE [Gammaproteobacteria bacterium]